MYLSLRHLLYALLIAVAVYIVREVRRGRRRVRPRRPDFRIEEAWANWKAGIARHPDQRLLTPLANPSSTPAPLLASIEQSLRETERLAAQADNPRLFLRRAALSSATLALQLAAIAEQDEPARRALIQGYEEGMDSRLRDAVAAHTARWVVLREYARWKFDDAVPNDWFHHYMDFAGPYVREKVRLAREFILRADPGAGRFVQIYDQLLAELRDRVLKTPPKKRFVPAGLPTH